MQSDHLSELSGGCLGQISMYTSHAELSATVSSIRSRNPSLFLKSEYNRCDFITRCADRAHYAVPSPRHLIIALFPGPVSTTVQPQTAPLVIPGEIQTGFVKQASK